MKLKMAQLVEQTGVPKSTILYYLKEGLLPQPQRLKQNVCLYDESCIEQIKFIKFLQTSYGRSIADIKEKMCANTYDFSKGSDMLISFLEKLSGASVNSKKMSKKELIKHSKIKPDIAELLIQKGAIISLSNEVYDEKDLEILTLYGKLIDTGWDISFFEQYIALSKKLAEYTIKEVVKAKQKIKDGNETDNAKQHLMFEIPLNLGPYIINRLSILEHNKINYQVKK